MIFSFSKRLHASPQQRAGDTPSAGGTAFRMADLRICREAPHIAAVRMRMVDVPLVALQLV
jgi:hypothetical protein